MGYKNGPTGGMYEGEDEDGDDEEDGQYHWGTTNDPTGCPIENM